MVRTVALVTAVLHIAGSSAIPQIPSVALKNAAVPGLLFPATGLGTGGYASDTSVGYGGYPECWSQPAGCGPWVTKAVLMYLQQAGGRRIDNANSYQNQATVGEAIALSGVPRNEIFLLSKVGPSQPLGYNDTLAQFAQAQKDLQTSYVDILLVHWPWDSASQGNVTNNMTTSTDPACNHSSPVYNEKNCRISTWKAMVKIFQSGGALAIGVSNFNQTHIQEIIDAGLPLPALNQCPFNVYRSSSQMDLVNFCRQHDIVFNGYSPLGVPDWHAFPKPLSKTPLVDPTVVAIAQAHNASPAQIIQAWEWSLGIPVNPRSMSLAHMQENLASYQITLTPAEIQALSTLPQDTCAIDPTMYECANTTTTTRPFGFGVY